MNKLQVLVVDDEWNMRNLLRIYLAKNGFHVIEAKNGHEALSVMDGEDVDLIILDVMMPDMDGWDVCRKIRQTKDTPILMLTARNETKYQSIFTSPPNPINSSFYYGLVREL